MAKLTVAFRGLLLLCFLVWNQCANAATTPEPVLDLHGYVDAQGAISIQYQGNTIDPYFAMQALLLAKENGLDISGDAMKWANWLVVKQKLDGTFDRYCRNGPVWAPCKTADADDALMAIWMKYLSSMPQELKNNPQWAQSFQHSAQNLRSLLEPARGIYLVSPVYQHGLLMDNLEVYSFLAESSLKENRRAADSLSKNIQATFWSNAEQQFLVSTQPEQHSRAPTFYPDQVAQIYPLLFDFKLPQMDRKQYYQHWMKKNRAAWLMQSHDDFAWGLIAVIAYQQGDRATASCWLRETSQAEHTQHWIVTDEVAKQILLTHAIQAASVNTDCQ